jgi:hypothetical protein
MSRCTATPASGPSRSDANDSSGEPSSRARRYASASQPAPFLRARTSASRLSSACSTEDADDVFRAIVERDPAKTVALVNGYDGPREPLEQAIGRAAAEDHSVAPIMVAHTVKTAQASIVESRALGEERGARGPIAAAARFLASPKRERFVYQATLEAVAFVEGRSKGEAEEGS